MKKLILAVGVLFLIVSCGLSKGTTNHCKKVHKDAYKVQQNMERARRRASRAARR